MEIFRRTDTGMRSLLIAAAIVVVIAGMKASQPIVLPLLGAAMIAILFVPAIAWLQEKRLPDWLALSIVLVGVLAAFALVTVGVGRSVVGFKEALEGYQEQLALRYGNLLGTIEANLPESVDLSLDTVQRELDPGKALSLAGDFVGAAADLLSNTFLIVLTVMFILGEAAGFPRKLAAAFPRDREIEGESHEAVDAIRSYLRIKTELSLATGGLAGVLVAVLGVDFPILWGAVAFAFNFVPNIGSIVAAIPPLLLAFVQFGWQRALVVAAGYAVINTVIGNVLEPRLMGRKLGLSSLVVWLSLVFWGWVWGPVGMLLSVPLTMLVKLLLERSDDLRWVAVLLGPAAEAQPDPEAAVRARQADYEALDDAQGAPPAADPEGDG